MSKDSWHVIRREGFWWVAIGENVIAQVGPGEGDRARALVMAAGPDMLEALKSIENDDGSIPKTIWDLRNAAIAKAKGEGP